MIQQHLKAWISVQLCRIQRLPGMDVITSHDKFFEDERPGWLRRSRLVAIEYNWLDVRDDFYSPSSNSAIMKFAPHIVVWFFVFRAVSAGPSPSSSSSRLPPHFNTLIITHSHTHIIHSLHHTHINNSLSHTLTSTNTQS